MMRPKDLRQGSGTKTFLDAMHGGKVHLARFILDALDGRIINSKTENNRTPLMFAVRLQDPGPRAKFTQLLLEKEADVNCQDEDGRTALSHACELGHLEVVKLLVQFNADPDISDVWGNSSLMYAAFSGHSQVLEFLVRAFKRLGLRLDRTNNAGHSAVQVAKFFGHHQCVQVLNLPCRKGAGTDNRLVDAGGANTGDIGRPNRLPKHMLERFSSQHSSQNGDQLPGVFQRQLKISDGNGLFNRFRCPSGPSPEDGTHHWTLPQPPERGEAEGDTSLLFTAKQLQNCQLRDLGGGKTLNSTAEPSQKDVRGLKQERPESLPLWGKAKSFNLDLLSARKQSYQGEERDNSLSASRLKRASLQDDRSLIGKTECQGSTRAMTGDIDTTVPVPKALFSGKSHSVRLPGQHGGPQGDDGGDATPSGRREQPKRGSLPQASSRNTHKLLFSRREVAEGVGDVSSRAPGLTGLGTRLLRRFTAPEFMRMVIDCSSGSLHGGRGQISRSETFPFSHTHMQVNSQPSVDSISGVKCEFESGASQATLH